MSDKTTRVYNTAQPAEAQVREHLIERKISATDTQWEAWKVAARAAGVSLRQWIRDTLNREAAE